MVFNVRIKLAALGLKYGRDTCNHWTWMRPIHVRFTIVYRTWIGFISDLLSTVHVLYTSGSTDARPVHILLVYVMYIFHALMIDVHRT